MIHTLRERKTRYRVALKWHMALFGNEILYSSVRTKRVPILLFTFFLLPHDPHNMMRAQFGTFVLGLFVLVQVVLTEQVIEHGLYGLRVRLRTVDYRRHIVHVARDRSTWTERDRAYSKLFVLQSTFRVVRGLSGYATVTLEAVATRGFYLHAENYIIALRAYKRSEDFRKKSSFVVHDGIYGHGGISFESVRHPGYFLRRLNSRLRIAPLSDGERFQRDATWRVELEPKRIRV